MWRQTGVWQGNCMVRHFGTMKVQFGCWCKQGIGIQGVPVLEMGGNNNTSSEKYRDSLVGRVVQIRKDMMMVNSCAEICR